MKLRNKLKWISFILFAFFIAAVTWHVNSYTNRVFRYSGFEQETSYLVKGNSYSRLGDSLQKQHAGMLPGDILKDYLGGPEYNEQLWDDSLKDNTLCILGTYCLVVIFFAAIVTLLLEILVNKYKSSHKKGNS